MQYLSIAAIAYFLFLTFILGLCIGSFSNAWAFRIVSKESIAKGRSHCPKCGHDLAAWDLVPLFSWLFLKGRCRYCRQPIAIRYPAAEAVCGLYFISAALTNPWDLNLIRIFALGGLLLVMSLQDLDSMEIEDYLIAGAAGLSLLRIPAEGIAAAKDMLWGLIPAAVLLALVLVMDRIRGMDTMGGADIKLAAALGLHFGPFQMLLLLILSSFAGLLFAAAAKKKEEPFPFGPCLAAGAWAVVLFGAPLLNAYLSLF